MIEDFKSGIATCSDSYERITEFFFTGLDELQCILYFVLNFLDIVKLFWSHMLFHSDLGKDLAKLDVFNLIRVTQDTTLDSQEILYASQIKSFTCSSVSFLFIQGFSWTAIYRDGRRVKLYNNAQENYGTFTPRKCFSFYTKF